MRKGVILEVEFAMMLTVDSYWAVMIRVVMLSRWLSARDDDSSCRGSKQAVLTPSGEERESDPEERKSSEASDWK